MSNEQRVIKLEPYGPADTGMEEMQLDQADFQSAAFMLAAWILTTTSSGPTTVSGISTKINSSGPPNLLMSAAFIVFSSGTTGQVEKSIVGQPCYWSKPAEPILCKYSIGVMSIVQKLGY